MGDKDRHLFDIYSHKLRHKSDLALARKIEVTAKLYAEARDKGEESRAESRRLKLLRLCFEYFYVVGDDMSGVKGFQGFDEAFEIALQQAVDGFNPKLGMFIPRVAFLYSHRVLDEGKDTEKDNSAEGAPIESLDAHHTDESHDERFAFEDEEAFSGGFSSSDAPLSEGQPASDGVSVTDDWSDDNEDRKDENDGLAAMDEAKAWWGETREDEYGSKADAGPEQPVAQDVVGIVLGHVLVFLDHREDGRHQPQSKLYMRMVFTERSTYTVKSQQCFEDCEAFERHERDTLRAAELPFLSSFVDGIAPDTWSIRLLWESVFKEKYEKSINHLRELFIRFEQGEKGLTPPKVSWLEILDYQNYLRDRYGIDVSSPVISQQREKFNRFEEAILKK